MPKNPAKKPANKPIYFEEAKSEPEPKKQVQGKKQTPKNYREESISILKQL
jgi:hypothetical protein